MSGIGIGRCCVKCRVVMVPLKNEVAVVELVDNTPYKLWCADLIHCPECDYRLITGFGQSPIAINFQEDFEEKLAWYRDNMPFFEIDGKRRMLSQYDGRDHTI